MTIQIYGFIILYDFISFLLLYLLLFIKECITYTNIDTNTGIFIFRFFVVYIETPTTEKGLKL